MATRKGAGSTASGTSVQRRFALGGVDVAYRQTLLHCSSMRPIVHQVLDREKTMLAELRAGLYKLAQDGDVALTHRQVLAGAFTLTLFVPCIATFMMMWKERGARLAMVIFASVTSVALVAGACLNQLLLAMGWK